MNIGDSAQINGCSTKTRHLTTSSGNSSIDSLLGGGIPNTSIYVVDEIDSRVYGNTLVKYFISEGIYNDHDIFIAGPSDIRDSILTSLPSRVAPSTEVPKNPSAPNENMKIAWRYEGVNQVNSSIGNKSNYDLIKTLSNFEFSKSSVKEFPEKDESLSYSNLYETLRVLLKEERYSKQRGPKKNLLRVVIVGIGSPLWSDPENFSAFTARLQMMTRDSYVVSLVTASTNLMKTEQVRELEVTSDVYFRLVSITEEDKKKIASLDKFHGYFRIVKLPTIVSPATHRPEAVDLVFDLHRKSFDIKILHLPPALGDDNDAGRKSACNVDF